MHPKNKKFQPFNDTYLTNTQIRNVYGRRNKNHFQFFRFFLRYFIFGKSDEEVTQTMVNIRVLTSGGSLGQTRETKRTGIDQVEYLFYVYHWVADSQATNTKNKIRQNKDVAFCVASGVTFVSIRAQVNGHILKVSG